ncbi:MAG TPA: acylphosphatase [Candidatus Binatia bacterium]|nr:acylphosphatase [Candidatus Binatia bacterium]
MNAAVRVELRIRGRVQGVFYRASARQRARELGLTGYARNCDDGSVEIIAEGEERRVEQLIAWCRTGPPGARVETVDVRRVPATGEFSGFEVD